MAKSPAVFRGPIVSRKFVLRDGRLEIRVRHCADVYGSWTHLQIIREYDGHRRVFSAVVPRAPIRRAKTEAFEWALADLTNFLQDVLEIYKNNDARILTQALSHFCTGQKSVDIVSLLQFLDAPNYLRAVAETVVYLHSQSIPSDWLERAVYVATANALPYLEI